MEGESPFIPRLIIKQVAVLLLLVRESRSCNKQQFDASHWLSGSPKNRNVTSLSPNCMYCNIQCDGCYGPDASDCIKCRHFNLSDSDGQWQCVSSCPHHYFEDRCLNECPENTYHYDVEKPECLSCDSQCMSSCTDITAWNCTQCSLLQMPDGRCVNSCSDGYTTVDNLTCSKVSSSSENDDYGMPLQEMVAMGVAIGLLVVVISLWSLLCAYLRWRRSTGNHNLRVFTNQIGTLPEHQEKKETAAVDLTLQQSAFAVNPTQYVDDWLDGEHVTTADWLAGEQRVTLANPLFQHKVTSQQNIENASPELNNFNRQSAFHSSDTAGYYTDTEEDIDRATTSDQTSVENEVRVSDEAISNVFDDSYIQ